MEIYNERCEHAKSFPNEDCVDTWKYNQGGSACFETLGGTVLPDSGLIDEMTPGTITWTDGINQIDADEVPPFVPIAGSSDFIPPHPPISDLDQHLDDQRRKREIERYKHEEDSSIKISCSGMKVSIYYHQ